MDYDPDTLGRIPTAIHNLIEVTRRDIRAQSTTAYTEEAMRRFKIDVLQDQDALGGASDRIREEFRAYLRGLHQLGEDGVIHGAVRNYACLVLDRSVVCVLADLTFPDDSDDDHLREEEDWRLFREITIKLVDAWWERPVTNASAYRGVDRSTVRLLLSSTFTGRSPRVRIVVPCRICGG